MRASQRSGQARPRVQTRGQWGRTGQQALRPVVLHHLAPGDHGAGHPAGAGGGGLLLRAAGQLAQRLWVVRVGRHLQPLGSLAAPLQPAAGVTGRFRQGARRMWAPACTSCRAACAGACTRVGCRAEALCATAATPGRDAGFHMQHACTCCNSAGARRCAACWPGARAPATGSAGRTGAAAAGPPAAPWTLCHLRRQHHFIPLLCSSWCMGARHRKPAGTHSRHSLPRPCTGG